MKSYQVCLPVFEGPLDLLLSLIEREELDITRVSLAQIAGQYLAYLEQVEEVRPDLLADFLVIAAQLVLIKSEVLLPGRSRVPPEGEPEAGIDLVEQLKQYRLFKAAARQLQARQAHGIRTYLRLAPPPKIEPQPDLSEVTLADLLNAVRLALELEPPAPPVDRVISRRTVTVKGQMALMLDRLLTSDQLVFQELLAQTFSRLEIAVTLLALLELIKLGQVGVYQERLFGSIVIRSRAAQAENASAAAR